MDEPRKGRQTPTQSIVLPYTKTYGNEAVDIYNTTGRTAQEWQELLCYDIMAVNDDGLWVHTKAGYSLSRRNGKNEVVVMREMWGLKHGEKILHTAHRTTTSHAAWERLCGLLDKAKIEYKSILNDPPKMVHRSTRRHDNCKCMVDYNPGDGKIQSVHTGKEGKRTYVQDKYGGYEKTKEARIAHAKEMAATEEARKAAAREKRIATWERKKKDYLLEKENKGDTIVSGAVSGARNPYGKKAQEHAEKYYGLVRSMKTDVKRISNVTGISENEIQSIKNFIFLEKHDLGNGELEFFEPDYMMAESWQRLIEGKPKKHDITMLRHEILEKSLINEGLSQSEAHVIASEKYNYSKEASEYYANIKKYRKE